MLEFLSDKKIRVIIWNSVLIVLGLLFACLPNKAISVVETIVFVCLIVYGVYCILGFSLAPASSREPKLFYEGLIYVIAGVLLTFIENVLIIFIGAYLVVQGFNQVSFSIDLKNVSANQWYVDCIISFASIIVGAIIIILCKKTLTILSILIGISLVVYGASNLVRIFFLKRDFYEVKTIKETNEESDKEDKDNNSEIKDDDFTDFSVK